ncbi:MAG: ABC transporter ATP-binding protein [Candidatus Gracilibacteria bacterium]
MNIKKVRSFFSPIKKQKLLTMFSVLFSAYLFFFWVFSVEIIKRITQAIEEGNINNLYSLTIFFVCFIFSLAAIRWLGKDIFPVFRRNSKNYIQNKYIKEFFLFENNSYEQIGTGKLIALIEKGINTWSQLLADFGFFGLQIIFSFIFSFLYIYNIIGVYTVVILLIVVFLFFITKIVNIRAIRARSRMIDYGNLYTKDLVKIIMSKFEILQNNQIKKEISNLKYLNDRKAFYFTKRLFWLEINFGLNILFNNMLKIGAILIVGIGVIKGTYNFSDFIAIITILTILDSNVREAVDFYKNFTKEYVRVEKLYELFDNTPKIQGYDSGKKFKYKIGNYKIKNLCFSYPGKKVFKNFSLNIKGGKKTAIIGRSGSGKTTLIKILSGFLRANLGEILIDNQDLNKLSLKSYYKHIGYLTQEPSIFDGTIIDNLTYGSKKRLSNLEIKNALEKAEASFVYDFKDGIDTEIGERGIRLSGGQRQRLAIAKIFIKDPEIIILDEPTSALDSFSEETVTNAINNLFEGRTVIIIAHRLQTVKEADDIIVLDDFKVIERGTHKKLLKSGKYYKKMVDLQSGLLLD